MKQLQQEKTLTLLNKYRIPTAKSIVSSKKEAVHTDIGFPVVLKVVSEDIVHKTDVGGVVTGIRSRSELAKHLHEMDINLSQKFPDAEIRYMVQKQESGVELIIGMKRDAQFGPVILFGLGGVFVEVYKDVAFRVAPLARKDVMDMIREVKAYKILSGFRGTKVNIDAVADILLKISKLSVRENDIMEIDFNPVIANEKAVVVDWRMMIDGS